MRALIEREADPRPRSADEAAADAIIEQNRQRFRDLGSVRREAYLDCRSPKNAKQVEAARSESATSIRPWSRQPEQVRRVRARSFGAVRQRDARRQSRPDHSRANDARIRAGAVRARTRPTVEARSPRATASTSSGLSASTKVARCPTNSWPTVSPTICARACAGGPTRNTSRGLFPRRASRALSLPAPTRCACIEEGLCSAICWPN